MKKTLVVFAILIISILIVTPKLVGFQVWNIPAAIDMATGMGAKLACSSRYVTGLSEEQAKADIVSYSAAAALLELRYDDQNQTVTATLQGMAEKQAKHRNGQGCSLELGDTSSLNSIAIQPIKISNAPWPNGEDVSSINDHLQKVVEAQLAQDNLSGLQTRALLVVKDNRIIAESYTNGFDQNSKLLGWSMAKSVTSMMLGRLDAMKKIDFTQSHLFDEWKNDERKNLNLIHLLQMSSGLDFDEPYVPGSDSTKMLFTAASASDVAKKSKLAHPPSEHFYYSSGTTNLLARWLYEEVGNTPQAMMDFTYQELFAPLNMSHSIFESDSSGVLVGSSYLYASARDWARLAQLLLNNGQWNDQQLISKDWVKAASQANTSFNDKRYGYQFWLNAGHEELRWPNIPADAYAMQGNRSQRVMMIPSLNISIVRLGWTSGEYPLNKNFSELIESIK